MARPAYQPNLPFDRRLLHNLSSEGRRRSVQTLCCLLQEAPVIWLGLTPRQVLAFCLQILNMVRDLSMLTVAQCNNLCIHSIQISAPRTNFHLDRHLELEVFLLQGRHPNLLWETLKFVKVLQSALLALSIPNMTCPDTLSNLRLCRISPLAILTICVPQMVSETQCRELIRSLED